VGAVCQFAGVPVSRWKNKVEDEDKDIATKAPRHKEEIIIPYGIPFNRISLEIRNPGIQDNISSFPGLLIYSFSVLFCVYPWFLFCFLYPIFHVFCILCSIFSVPFVVNPAFFINILTIPVNNCIQLFNCLTNRIVNIRRQ